MNRSEMMAAVRSKDTQPEMAVRRIIFKAGYRYRLHKRDLPGKPDIVFASRKKVIFVHGCFWHQHKCRSGHLPKSNTAYWIPKLERNKKRDRETARKLKALGWDYLIIWECEIEKSTEGKLLGKIQKFLNKK